MESKHTSTRTNYLNFVAGAVSGIMTKTIIAPIERVKIIFQVQDLVRNPSAKGEVVYGRSIRGCFTKVLSLEGFSGFFKGNMANILRVVPMYSIKLASNDIFKKLLLKKDQEEIEFRQLVASGSMAGLLQISCTYPLDVVRTRLAVSSQLGVKERTISSCLCSLYRHEGYKGFYKGFGLCLLTGTPCIAIHLAMYDRLKKAIAKPGMAVSFFCGAVAGFTAQSLTYWGDTVKRRMQSNGLKGQTVSYRGSFDCLWQTTRNEGVRGLYRGYGANILRGVPGGAIQLLMYDYFKKGLNYTSNDASKP